MRAFEKVLDLSYGENPHQRAAYYAQTGARTDLLSMVSKLHGKALSFNNLLDLDAGRKLIEEFEVPACAIIKHNNPCGCALGGGPDEAFRKALEGDPMSAFGGIVCFNRKVDRYTAEQVHELFVELIFAPGYDDDALDVLQQKKNIRILDNQERRDWPISEHDIKRVRGGILIQHRDEDMELRDEMQVVTKRKPTEQEWGDLLFAWKVAKHVRSNAIVLSKRPGDGRHRRRPDEPRGLRPPGGREGAAAARGRGAGIGRLLPVPGRPPAGDRRGRPLAHPARRLTARRRGGRRLRRRGRGDGLHGAAPLPALTG